MKLENTFEKLEQQLKTSKSDLSDWSSNYFKMHRTRYKSDLKLITKHLQSGKLLELGSAPYHLTYLLKECDIHITGVDIAPERFKDFISDNELNIHKCNIEVEQLPFKDNQFDCILFNEIFEHLRINPIDTLTEINRVLKNDGVLILTTPNLYSVRNVVNFLLGKGFDSPYQEFSKLNTIGHMGHVREYTPNQVSEFLTHTGYEIIDVKMQSHIPLSGMWSIFNIVRKILPQFHSYQIQIAKKV